jgi:hypothetical protein
LHQDPQDLHSKLDPAAIADAAARAHEEDPIRIKQHNIELEEDGARIALTIVDTPGFGEGIDNEHWWVLRNKQKADEQFPGDLYIPWTTIWWYFGRRIENQA